MAGSNRGKRESHAAAQAAHRQTRLDGRGRGHRRGCVSRDFADWAPNPEQNYTQSELAEILKKTIQGLPQGFRVVFVLRDVEGLSMILVFQGPGSDTLPANASLQLDATPAPGAATVILRKEDARYLQPARPDALPATPKTVRDLNVLLKVSRTLNSVRGLAALQEKVLDAILAIVPADQAAILLTENGPENVPENGTKDRGSRQKSIAAAPSFSSIVGRDRRLGPNQPIHASQTILNHVLAENLAVLSNDIQSDDAYREAESLLERRVHSVMAVPLEIQEKMLGVLYLEASSPGARFDSDLLQLVTTLGNIAALAIENARHSSDSMARTAASTKNSTSITA